MPLYTSDYEPQFSRFHDLMQFRVREILLVSSFYDAFVLEEDGGISERIFSEYIDLNLRFIPRVHRVSNAEQAFNAMEKKNFDMVITMTRISDMNIEDFGLKIKERKPGMPVILLTYEWVEVDLLIKFRKCKAIDKVFYWTGDTRILLAIIKYIEDLKNVDNDVKLGVRVIPIIEDSPRFYSLFLPILYTEIMTQTRVLISEGVNDLHRLLRMRARPKILMAETLNQANEIIDKYKSNLLGIISDVRFPCEANECEVDREAGFKLAEMVKRAIPDLPFLLQSSNMENKEVAYHKGVDFLYKNSNNLLHDLHRFVLNNFGFGDFVFRCEDGREVGRAGTLQDFERMLQIIPLESLNYHAKRNHISIWLRARTEFQAAERMRPKRMEDFGTPEQARQAILTEIRSLLQRNQFGVIGDFGKTQYDSKNSFVKLGGGSMGGKARGIAFLNALLAQRDFGEKFANLEIRTPHTFVICSDVFDEFVRENNLQEFAISEQDNEVIAQRFREGKLPPKIIKDIAVLLEKIKYPIAVRSSSLLEDSQALPFAGLYYTFMLPNSHPDFPHRMAQLCGAIKMVFASVFYKSPKEYVKNTNFRIEEEKMAVIIQQIAGETYNGHSYPVVSGVGQSYNFYPYSYQEPEDGVVELALGLGATIADGGKAYRFSPRYPQMNPPFSTPVEFLKKSQSHFYALNMEEQYLKADSSEKFSLLKLDLTQAEEDGTLFFVGSTFSGADNAIRDTLTAKGPRVVTFANLLKYNVFPLADVVDEILKLGKEAFGCHVEIEFAVQLYKDKSKKAQFYLLQIRPMVVGRENLEISMEDIDPETILCRSIHSMGNAVFDNIYDLVFVDPETFNPGKSQNIAYEVGEMNKKLDDEGREYILIGFGRWGTSDPWLGIPVEWHQMARARVVLEANLDTFNIEPSLGSHFFHNLTSLGLGYFHIAKQSEDQFIKWDWLKKQTPHSQTQHLKHIRLDKPFTVKINARDSSGVILKP